MKRKVYLNEFNILMGDRVYLPLTSAMLRAFAESKDEIEENYVFMPFLFVRDNPSNILKKYEDPSVAAFSSSMWNHQLNLFLAERVKEQYPDCLIIFGGPHIPDNPLDFMKDNSFIDVLVHGEGEVTFSDLLTQFMHNRDFRNILGITYRDSVTGSVVKNETRPLIRDVNILPSPFLLGFFDDLIDEGKFQYQLIFETMRGCPFSCSYCYWGKSQKGRLSEFSLERLEKEIEWLAKNKIQYIFCADSNFGMFNHDFEVSKLFVKYKNKYGFPETFRVCYGKNAEENNFRVAKLLNDNGLTKGVTLSFQSNNPVVLKNIKRRNISLEVYRNLQQRYHKENIPVYTEFILGLPGETYESFVKGIEDTVYSGLHDQLNIFFCEVLPNTDMADPVYAKLHGITTKRIELAEFHAQKRKEGEVREFDNIVITTNSMPLEDWKMSAKFAWFIQMFHGLKLGFFVFAHLFNKYKIKYSDFFKFVLEKEGDASYKIFQNELHFFNKYIDSVLNGVPQCVFLDGFGDISWAIDEASYLNISHNIDEFYTEFSALVFDYLDSHKFNFNTDEMNEIFLYQKTRVPNYRSIDKKEFTFQYNIPEYFAQFLIDEPIQIKLEKQKMILSSPKDFNNDKTEFAKRIVWFSRKDKGIIHAINFEKVYGK